MLNGIFFWPKSECIASAACTILMVFAILKFVLCSTTILVVYTPSFGVLIINSMFLQAEFQPKILN